MPELPEVETTMRGIKPHICGQILKKMVVRNRNLRWPIPKNLEKMLAGQTVRNIIRRGKYLIFQLDTGSMLLHLGMSGRLRVLENTPPPAKHDHVDMCFSNGKTLRFTDPRRFGAVLFTDKNIAEHPLLAHLGPEPLTDKFDENYLFSRAKSRKLPVKSFIMDSKIVVGVGNIYAAEALFTAGIHPEKPAGKINLQEYQKLAAAIKKILQQAIKKGGTTLKDFSQTDGKPGYFSIELQVYGKQNQPCPRCKTTLELIKIGQRSTVFCAVCQPVNVAAKI